MRISIWLKILFVLVVVVVAASLLGVGSVLYTIRRPWPKINGKVKVDHIHDEVTIIRDNWGIPHIYASTPYDLFFAQGYVHAQDRFWQMEFWRRTGTGRLSELLGPAALDSDRFLRTLGWHRVAAEELERLDQDTLEILEAYADGVNAYISTHKKRLGLEFTFLGLSGVDFEIEPWTPLNTLTWAQAMAWDLGGNRSAELLRAHIIARLGRDAVNVLMPPYSSDHPVIVPHPVNAATVDAIPDAAFDLTVLGNGWGIGSNNWVISGERTETGMPILADDPHLGIQMPSIWYEIGLHCEPVGSKCPYNVVGSSFAGVPGVIIGHNDHIAWGVTNLGPDVQDLFIEKVNPENPNQYEYKGEWEDMEIITETITVAGEDEPVVVRARLTRHGPIINDIAGGPEEDWAFGWQPLALSWTALQPSTLINSIPLLDRATNWEEFRAALKYWDVPSQNFVYADVEGNIGYQAPGRIPIRISGDGSAPVPGWTGEYEWKSYIPFDDLPYSFNPEEGYIATANNAVVGPDYPYLITNDWLPGYRARRIVELLEGNDSVSIADVQQMQADVHPVWADDVLSYLLVLPVTGTGRTPAEERDLTEGLELLRAWDRRADRDSAAAALFEAFRMRLIDLTFGDELGEQLLARARTHLAVALVNILADEDSPWFDNRNTLDVVETRDDILLQALEEAIGELRETLGNNMSRWRWGDLHQATFVNKSLGASGITVVERIFNRGPVEVDGTIATINNTGYSMRHPYAVRIVPSYRQIIDLGDLSNSVSMHTTGQSGHPFHRHYDDMIDPWRNVQYHPMLWERSDVEAAAEGTLILRPK